jgi:hypothetical protein
MDSVLNSRSLALSSLSPPVLFSLQQHTVLLFAAACDKFAGGRKKPNQRGPDRLVLAQTFCR